jgi:hypothetical protein
MMSAPADEFSPDPLAVPLAGLPRAAATLRPQAATFLTARGAATFLAGDGEIDIHSVGRSPGARLKSKLLAAPFRATVISELP